MSNVEPIFRDADTTLIMPAMVGQPLARLLDEVPDDLRGNVIVVLNGAAVFDLDGVMMQAGDEVRLHIVPAGGNDQAKAILASVAMIAISLAAGPIAGMVFAKGTVGYYALTAGITLVGSLVVSALIPPPALPRVEKYSAVGAEDRSYAITGQSNTTRLYSTVPRLYGRHRFYPYLMTTPRVDTVGKTSSITAVYDFGIGDIEISDLRVGNLAVDELEPDLSIHENDMGQNLQLMHRLTAYESYNWRLEKDVPFRTRTRDGSTSAVLDVHFPSGLVQLDRNGNRKSHSVPFDIRYREQGTATWTTVPATDYHGAGVNTQNWIWSPRYTYSLTTGKGTDYWLIWNDTVDGDTRTGIKIVVGGVLLYSAHSTRKQYTENQWTIGGRPYRRGVLRETGPNPDRNNQTYTLYEILVPDPVPADAVIVSEATQEPFTLGVQFQFPHAAVWEIEVVRRTEPNVGEDAFGSIRDLAVVSLLKSHRAGNSLALKRPHSFVELKFTANDKVSGVVDNLNAIGWSRLRTVTPTGWGPVRLTSNNALIALDILAGAAARTPLRDDQIDFPSWHKLMELCDEQVTQTVAGVTYLNDRYQWNGIIEENITTQEALHMVLAPARATWRFTGTGRIGVIIDREQTTYRQLITTANSWGFEGVRTFTKLPDAIRVEFLDEAADWQPRQCMVYRDGFGEANAELIEDLQAPGVTSFPHAWRYGRYMMAQGIIRNEQFKVHMDVENLVVQRGDLVAVQHDVPAFGSMSMRVVSVAGNDVTMDRPLDLALGVFAVRQSDGSVRQGVVTQVNPYTWTFSDATGMAEDDLVALGTSTRAIVPYLVHSIAPAEDMAAQLTLVLYDPRVYEAENAPLPTWDPNFGGQAGTGLELTFNPPEITWVYRDRVPYARVRLTWNIVGLETYRDASLGWRWSDTARELLEQAATGTEYVFEVPWSAANIFDVPLIFDGIPRTYIGNEGVAGYVTTTIPAYDVAPEAPRNVFLDVRSQELSMFWDASTSLDVSHYLIRYTPDLVDPQWNVAQHLGRQTWDQSSFSCGARTGSYMIRAQNAGGILSAVVTVRTTVETLPDINLVELIDEAPAWPGGLVNLSRGLTVGANSISPDILVATAPTQAAVAGVAHYIFQKTVDLGDVYEVRVANRMRVAAVELDNLGGNVTPGSVPPLLEDHDTEWNVWLDYRAAVSAGFIHAWQPLHSVASMSGGGANFGPWRKVNVGDVTGRILQFRLTAESFNPRVAVLFLGGTVEVDVVDRQWSKPDVAVPATGITVPFDPPFMVRPAVAVSIVGATAVRHEMTHDRTSVTLTLFDAAGAAVAGVADITALGYGRQRTGAI